MLPRLVGQFQSQMLLLAQTVHPNYPTLMMLVKFGIKLHTKRILTIAAVAPGKHNIFAQWSLDPTAGIEVPQV
jgi:hypothetical protein